MVRVSTPWRRPLTSHDQLAKELFQNFFADLIRLAAPAAAQRLRLAEASFRDKQAFTDWPEGDRREMDLVAEVPIAETGLPALVHIEIEAVARTGMGERFWLYYMQLRLRHGLPVFPLLINLKGGRPDPHDEEVSDHFGTFETARFRFRVFGLSGCSAAEYLARPEPLAWALAALMRRGRWSPAEHKIECLRRIATAELPASQSFLLGNWVETYLQLRGRQAEEYDRLRDLSVNREVRAMQMTWAERMEAEYTQKGIEQGLAQGLAEGIGRGIEALRNVVLHQMKQRFGSVPETVRSKVEAIQEIEPLSDLAERVLEVDSIDEMGLS
jgi:hypothetical protein